MTSPRLWITVLAVVLGFQTGAATTASDSLINASWRSWESQEYALAEKQFKSAIAADPASPRGYIGLALLQDMQDKYRDCWDALRLLSEQGTEIHPYLFAFWQTIRFRLKNDYSETGLLEYLERAFSAGDAMGVLPPQIAEALEEYYRERHRLRESDDWHLKINALSDWMLIGPFENVSASGYDKVYPPETDYDPSATYEGKGGIPASWFAIVSSVPGTWIDFMRHFGAKQSVFYANTFVYSPTRISVHVRVGTSGSLRTFLNDEMILEYFDENNNDLDTYIAATELQQGWNRVLVKCGFSEIDKCNFLLRIVDEHGRAIDGLRVSTEVHPYPHRPAAPVTVLEHPFESFFKKEVETYPDRPENYALLAQLYLRDDKAPQAERVLRTALQRWPRCNLLYTLMMEAYQRGEKHDEIEELLVKLSAIDSRSPEVGIYRAYEALRNEEYQKAEELIARLKEMGYNPESMYQIEMELLGKRKEIDRLVALSAEAYGKYPLNWEFASFQALIESEIRHDPGKSAEVIKDYLTRNYGLTQLSLQANYYLKAGKLDRWEATMKEALALSPTATGYVYSMGLVYQLAKDYAKAEEAFRRALALSPSSALYRSKLAEVYKTTGRTEEAKEAYRAALQYGPKEFDSRDALRSLEGKEPIFSAFGSYAIDSLIHAAPGQKDYENDDGVILLDDRKRVVLDRGASMTTSEYLVKVFTTRGIDAWKEYAIGYNQYNEELIVEKAVSIKRDGTEVKADVNNGQVVFKSLEPNDCIYLKWKVKDYYSGMLASHFWDTHYFNGFYPIRISRYSLLVPKKAEFTHRTQFMSDQPAIREVEEGTLYEWQQRDEPAIRYEQGMPVYEDVAKAVYVTSLPSWEYVAKWFSDLARTKTRTTFEIKEQVAKLFDRKASPGSEEKVRAIYDFIVENIRYSSVSFRQSAFVPQRARDVLVQRMGDCKDMATLCIAMLKEAGIPAHHVLVNTWNDGMNRNIPPLIAFNHCIVGVELPGGVRHIDLTAANLPFGGIPPYVNRAFSLAITDSTKMPALLAPGQFQPNNITRTSTAVLDVNNNMLLVSTALRTGAAAASMRNYYRNKSKTECLKSLTETLIGDHPTVQVKDLTFTGLDQLDPVMEDRQEYTVPQFMTEAGGFKLIKMPWKDRLEPNEALSYESRRHPYVLGAANDTLRETLHMKLPAGYALQEVPKSTAISCSNAAYRMEYRYSKGELTATRTFSFDKPEVSPDEYPKFKKFYNEVLKEDNRQLLLKSAK